MKKIDMQLSNYYGCVEAFKNDDGVCWMELENWDGVDRVNITPMLWGALEKDFGSHEADENDH